MKKFVAMSAVAAMAVMASAATDAEFEALKKELSTLKEQVKEIKIHDAGDNIKFSASLRAAVEDIKYKSANGNEYRNPNLMTNRLELGMSAQPAENLTFNGLLAYNKAYGANPPANGIADGSDMPQRGYGFDSFDWVVNQNLTDNSLKVKEASFFYYGDMGVPYTVSVGRRPSTDGLLANHREGASKAKSPLGHSINVEYDGASFLLKNLTDFGTSFKICAGRGLTNARSRFNMDGGLSSYGDYSESDSTLDSIDMYGIIFVPYDDGQYKLSMMTYHATNLPGFLMTDLGYNTGASTENTGMVKLGFLDSNNEFTTDGSGNFGYKFNNGYDESALTMRSLGDFDGTAISFQSTGIGPFGVSDFLDDTTFFVSYAMSKTTPNKDYKVINMEAFAPMMGGDSTAIATGLASFGIDVSTDLDGDGTPGTQSDFQTGMVMAMNGSAVDSGMLGSSDSETGSSIWAGLVIPAMFTDDGKIGFEYNQGDKYWRSFTYGEDTMIGSKIATRGTATEVYYNQPIVGEYLTMQIRHTAINYEYTGSQGFFGDEGMPLSMDDAKAMGMDPIETASDTRLSFTYAY